MSIMDKLTPKQKVIIGSSVAGIGYLIGTGSAYSLGKMVERKAIRNAAMKTLVDIPENTEAKELYMALVKVFSDPSTQIYHF